MKTVLVTTEVPISSGGIGTFTWNFAQLLVAMGEEVHILVANPTDSPIETWAELFRSQNITVSSAFTTSLNVPDGYNWHKRAAEMVAGMIPNDADVVYLPDWQGRGIDFVRALRFKAGKRPVVVTVLHGPTKWLREGNKRLPNTEEDLYLDFAESYLLKHSDYVVAPGQYMLDWVRSRGWELPADSHVRVLGIPFLPTITSSASTGRLELTNMRGVRPIEQTRLTVSRTATHEIAVSVDGRSQVIGSTSISETVSVAMASAVAKDSTLWASEPVDTQDKLGVVKARLNSTVSTEGKSAEGLFRRIVFFGRLETRKGLELFVDGLSKLKSDPCLGTVEEIVFLGNVSNNPYGSAETVVETLHNALGARHTVTALANFNTFEAQAYLAEHVHDTLVVIPSLRENYPLVVIEASLMPGLNVLCSNAGSIHEILGTNGQNQLFEPFVATFAAKLKQVLLAGPQAASDLGHYDWKAANQAWIAFHEEMRLQANERASIETPREASDSLTDSSAKSVDVCISYYNLGDYLPDMLASLDRQTSDDFNVIVVNDGSTDPASNVVFENMRRRYESIGWKFVTTPNQGLSAARNAGAAQGESPFLIFVDADDVLADNAVERLTTAIQRSGDDCLSCYFHLFRGSGWHPSFAHSSFYYYTPAGSDPLLGLISNPFGGAGCIVRREVFNSLGGFTTDVSRFVGYEDYEFYVRLMFAGFKQDVLPEFLLYYRIRDDGMFRTNDLWENKQRILRVYEDKLRQVGLEGLASFALGLSDLVQPTSARQVGALNSSLAVAPVDVPYLVYQVSGHIVWRALRVKLRNQVARRFGRPSVSGE